MFEGLPTAGLPYALSGWDAFEDYMETLISSKTIESIREVWWDIRPHPNFGTVELRVCDGIPTLDEISVVAALAQSLVESLDRQLDKGYTLPQPRMWLVRENKWRAARYGMDAEIVVDDRGHAVKPVKEAILELAEDLEPIARKLGCAEELMQVERIIERGASLPAAACRGRSQRWRSQGGGRLVADRDGPRSLLAAHVGIHLNAHTIPGASRTIRRPDWFEIIESCGGNGRP